MRARVVEIQPERGFGRALLASGETVSFDVSVSVLGIPVVGAELEVELGPSRTGGVKITRAEIIPTWEATVLPCLCLRRHDDEARAELLYVDRQAFRTWQHLPTNASIGPGTTGQLVLERKCGAANFFETRAVSWSVLEMDSASRERLLSAYRELLVDAWETWEHPDGHHTEDDLERLRADIFIGLDLGLDVGDLLTITDYAAEQVQPDQVHDLRAYSPPPGPIERKRQLTRIA